MVGSLIGRFMCSFLRSFSDLVSIFADELLFCSILNSRMVCGQKPAREFVLDGLVLVVVVAVSIFVVAAEVVVFVAIVVVVVFGVSSIVILVVAVLVVVSVLTAAVPLYCVFFSSLCRSSPLFFMILCFPLVFRARKIHNH